MLDVVKNKIKRKVKKYSSNLMVGILSGCIAGSIVAGYENYKDSKKVNAEISKKATYEFDLKAGLDYEPPYSNDVGSSIYQVYLNSDFNRGIKPNSKSSIDLLTDVFFDNKDILDYESELSLEISSKDDKKDLINKNFERYFPSDKEINKSHFY